MTDDPFGFALHELFRRLFLGSTRVPDLVVLGALLAGLAAAVSLPLPVRPVPSRPETRSRARGVLRGLALAAGVAVPGVWDLLAGRAGLGALQALFFGVCYGVARGARGEGLLATIGIGPQGKGYFGDLPMGVPYLASPALADAAGLLALTLFVVNVPLTLWRARRRPE